MGLSVSSCDVLRLLTATKHNSKNNSNNDSKNNNKQITF
jgi:hypothetical protein